MSELDPVPWSDVLAVTTPTGVQCEQVLEQHRDDLDPDATPQKLVRTLYGAWHEEWDPGPEQGGAYVFAYLLEREGILDLPGPLPPLTERRPDDETLDEWMHEEHLLPWWIAVRCGVHWALVQHWLREADVPVCRRNVPDPLLEEIDG